jgi:hypothetical protein
MWCLSLSQKEIEALDMSLPPFLLRHQFQKEKR